MQALHIEWMSEWMHALIQLFVERENLCDVTDTLYKNHTLKNQQLEEKCGYASTDVGGGLACSDASFCTILRWHVFCIMHFRSVQWIAWFLSFRPKCFSCTYRSNRTEFWHLKVGAYFSIKFWAFRVFQSDILVVIRHAVLGNVSFPAWSHPTGCSS